MTSRQIAALGLTAALAVGGATVAVGQGTGGSLGPKAQGSTTLQVRLSERSFGLHCANTNEVRRCRRDSNPRLAGVAGGNALLFEGDRRVGRAHFANIITQRGRRQSGAALFFATLILRDGTITVQGADRAPSVPSAITGGSGAYAGARGYMTEREAEGPRNEVRIDVTFTFIP